MFRRPTRTLRLTVPCGPLDPTVIPVAAAAAWVERFPSVTAVILDARGVTGLSEEGIGAFAALHEALAASAHTLYVEPPLDPTLRALWNRSPLGALGTATPHALWDEAQVDVLSALPIHFQEGL